MKKDWPALRSDEEAARFVAEADLTEYDFSTMVPVSFELRRKDRSVSLRLPEALLDVVKRAAARQGIPYQRFIRQAIERAVAAEGEARRGRAGRPIFSLPDRAPEETARCSRSSTPTRAPRSAPSSTTSRRRAACRTSTISGSTWPTTRARCGGPGRASRR